MSRSEQSPSQFDAVLKGLGIGCAVVALILPGQVTSRQSRPVVAHQQPVLVADFAGEEASPEIRRFASWIMSTADHRGMPFVLVDKQHVRVFVFEAGGRLLGATPALMGSAVGDDSVAGIGEREISAIQPHERTTPAGRFVSVPGVNSTGEDIVWVDYDAAVSMHRVRAKEPSERRLERLASATPDDNRISFGCINLPAPFYDGVVKPVLGSSRGVIYVLPETRSTTDVFQAYAAADIKS
ncbi:MAG TPA: hypothetical protein VE934_06450 [Polaromonas sp.]|uniref:hypothetical protein n=1 Tax=Polaromonas sp. TaxID=1869339 RepID=UPI002D74D968|nr:hypothetical protein [Polaromonas sp.]HYW56579.1 hypothetical protein [Polaromonas sp.]